RLQLLHVRAVSGLCHREAPGQLERGRRLQVALVVARRPQLLDGAAPQPELDSDLDQQREVTQRERLKAGHVRARVVATAQLLGKAWCGETYPGQLLAPLQHALAILGGGEADGNRELG